LVFGVRSLDKKTAYGEFGAVIGGNDVVLISVPDLAIAAAHLVAQVRLRGN